MVEAEEVVSGEVERLESARRDWLDRVETAFQELHQAVDARKTQVTELINSVSQDKLKVLNTQLQLIQQEKDKVGVLVWTHKDYESYSASALNE